MMANFISYILWFARRSDNELRNKFPKLQKVFAIPMHEFQREFRLSSKRCGRQLVNHESQVGSGGPLQQDLDVDAS